TTSRCSILRQTIRGLCNILDVRIAIYNLEHNLYKEQAQTIYQGLLIMLRTYTSVMERIIDCFPPNPRRVEYIDPIHGPLDGPLYMGSHIHQHPPQSELPAQRCSRLDNKKSNTHTHSELPAQR